VDLDGDCLAGIDTVSSFNFTLTRFTDVFLVCDDGRGGKTYQIWINKKDEGFLLSQEGALPAGMQAISFADIDRDGTIDLVFPTCSKVSQSTGLGSDCYINIAFNQQLDLCASTTISGMTNDVRVCRPPTNLCVADPAFKFNLTDSPSNHVSCLHHLFMMVVTTYAIGFCSFPYFLAISIIDTRPSCP
jgi:integrin alpha FG-GAP repeat containing protein 1